MVGDKYPNIFIFKLSHYGLYVLNRNWVYTSKRFIQHYKLRVDSKASGYFCASSFTSRKLISFVFTNFFKSELIYKTFKFSFLIFWRFIRELQDRFDIVFNTHFPEYGSFLSQ